MANEFFPELKGRFAFGCMRLPMNGKDVDIDHFCKMVDYYLDAGFNYFDTAHGYLEGKSETAIAEALVKRHPRDKFLIANKLTDVYFEKQEDIIPFFEKQLAWCGVDFFDFYLMHDQEKRNYDKFQKCKAFETALELKKQGKIKHLGFSFHDKVDHLERILNDHPEVEFVQIQFNYLDYDSEDVQSGKLYEVCEKYNKPVFVMEPVKGGKLAMLPDNVKSIFDKLGSDASYASYAVRYALNFPNNVLVLSGVSDIDQMKDNCASMKDPKPLKDSEEQAIAQAVAEFKNLKLVDCTGCSYCVTHNECPKNINIPQVFSIYNDMKIFDGWKKEGRAFYQRVVATYSGVASDCIACGACKDVCPQHLDIPKLLEDASKELE